MKKNPAKLTRNIFLSVVAFALIFQAAFYIGGNKTARAEIQTYTFADSGLNYTESQMKLVNPDQGFYRSVSQNLPIDTAVSSFSWESTINPAENGVFVASIGLDRFSARGSANRPSGADPARADMPLTPAALDTLRNVLQVFREKGAVVVIRFSYDHNAQDNASFSGFLDCEPANMSLIEWHVQQICGVLNDYLDVIADVQTGMFGPWGEQHSTTFGNTVVGNANNYYRLVQAWLDHLDARRGVSVRKPVYFAWWASERYNTRVSNSNMKDLDYDSLPDGGADAKRIGGWNDGYLGTSDDWGTYQDRTSEVAWLYKQSHNSFGGEAIPDNTSQISDFNKLSHAVREMFLTHTSDLNSSWNTIVHNHWKSTPYKLEDNPVYDDPVYNGTISSNTTGFVYIENHLGYRYVLRDSKISVGAAQGGILKINGKLGNVGFGSAVNAKTTEIILKQGSDIYKAEVSLDIQNVLSAKVFDFSVTLSLPDNMLAGEYQIYMRIRETLETTAYKDTAFRTVRFANNGANIWDAALGANLLGTVTVAAGSGANTEFEEIACDDYAEIIRSDAGGGTVWVSDKPGALIANGEGAADVIWDGATQGVVLSTQISGYADILQSFAASFVLYAPAKVEFSIGGKTLVSAQNYAAGTNVINIKDISGADAFLEAMTDETSFTLDVTIDGGVTVTTENRLFIKWVALYEIPKVILKTFKVTFNANGGTLVSGAEIQQIEAGQSAAAPVYTRAGYTFIGWSLSIDNIKRDKIIFAAWKSDTDTGPEPAECGCDEDCDCDGNCAGECGTDCCKTESAGKKCGCGEDCDCDGNCAGECGTDCCKTDDSKKKPVGGCANSAAAVVLLLGAALLSGTKKFFN